MHGCECECHDDGHEFGYRLFMGSVHEGLSIREVLLDEKGKIVDWSPHPFTQPASSIKEIKEQIVEQMRELDDMLEATERLILDEAQMEAVYGSREDRD